MKEQSRFVRRLIAWPATVLSSNGIMNSCRPRSSSRVPQCFFSGEKPKTGWIRSSSAPRKQEARREKTSIHASLDTEAAGLTANPGSPKA